MTLVNGAPAHLHFHVYKADGTPAEDVHEVKLSDCNVIAATRGCKDAMPCVDFLPSAATCPGPVSHLGQLLAAAPLCLLLPLLQLLLLLPLVQWQPQASRACCSCGGICAARRSVRLGNQACKLRERKGRVTVSGSSSRQSVA
jgi:hypothetical protein